MSSFTRSLITMFLILPSAFSQTAWKVDQGGSGDFVKIGDAVASTSVVNGDTIKVMKGTYSETGISVSKRVAIIAQDSVTLASSGTTAITFNPTTSHGSLFYNFTVTGGDIVAYGVTGATSGKRTVIAKNLLLERTIVTNGAAVVVNNIVRHTTTANPVGGIWQTNHGSSAAHTLIYNNDLRGCNLQINYGYVDVIANKVHAYTATFSNDAGLYITNSSNPHDIRVIGNTVDSCIAGLSGASGTGLYSFGGTNITVSNNIFSNCANGMYTSNSATIYTNNVVYNASVKGISGSSGYFYGNIIANSTGTIPSGSALWEFNCIFNSGTAPAGNGNITSDPLFTNAASGNFILQSGSPCIDAGHTATIYRDIDKSRMDMGLYGGPTSYSNFSSGSGPKMVDVLLTPFTVIQGNTITINASGLVE